MKLFAGLNVWALLLAAAASFVFGGIWYGVLSKQWMAAVGKTEADIKNAGRPLPYLLGLTFVCQLVMAWVLAGVILHLARAGVPATLGNGLISAFLLWLGFIATTLIVNHGYQGARRELTVIDGAHWLGVMLLQGAVLGLWGLAR
jgi:hypothetical protein